MSINSKELILFFSQQINELRQNPRSFGKLLHQRLTLFKDEFTYERSDMPNIMHKTQQGKKAVQEAISYLENIQSQVLKPLALSVQLCEIAYQISLSMSKQARVEDPVHYKKQIKQAISQTHCKIQNLQMIAQYGFRKDFELIPTIVVDDGNSSRNRRDSLMSASNKFKGIAVQEHSQYDFLVLILLTEDITLKSEGQEQTSQCSCSLI